MDEIEAYVPGAEVGQRTSLVDVLDRVLAGGVVATGDIELSIADVPLVRVSLQAVIASVSALAAENARGLGGDDRHDGRGR